MGITQSENCMYWSDHDLCVKFVKFVIVKMPKAEETGNSDDEAFSPIIRAEPVAGPNTACASATSTWIWDRLLKK